MASDLILLMANAQSEYMASSSKGTDPRRGSISYRFGFDSFQLTGLVDAEESDFPWDVKLNTWFTQINGKLCPTSTFSYTTSVIVVRSVDFPIACLSFQNFPSKLPFNLSIFQPLCKAGAVAVLEKCQLPAVDGMAIAQDMVEGSDLLWNVDPWIRILWRH